MKDTNWSLYLITEENLSQGRTSLEVVKKAVAGGVDAVQLRDKSLSVRERYSLGLKLKEFTASRGVKLIINDRVDLAQALDADGVHLGQDDLPLKEARAILGPDKIIGITATELKAAQKAEKEGADYLGVGSVFKSNSKKVAAFKAGIGTAGINKLRKELSLPITAIGGIQTANAAEVIKAGADNIAVISALSQAEDIQKSAQEFRKIIVKAKKEREV
ncbi:thiamine phosphate synthase [Halanaerobium hydrogeniformans]|uniref:Thiamine-phosphate synthase n=1 Tax=Halanaerobium hydrogeniformans TaxID=656519 RepID=E4RMU9_HALHG|nr:thiamine phosphate synthase [Halanaerobium hydrogeniformans]ADQ14166.1 thiamine-phosphate pyrophosphorylase [Halanaerobium hydrogeniformans]